MFVRSPVKKMRSDFDLGIFYAVPIDAVIIVSKFRVTIRSFETNQLGRNFHMHHGRQRH